MLVRPHLSIAPERRGLMTKPDPSLLQDVVAPKIIDAMSTASAALTRAGVRHAVAGGLAVGANGHPRSTRDVDFLVGDEAFERHAGGLVTLKAGVPFQVNNVAVDFLTIGPGEEFLESALNSPTAGFLDAAPLVYLKLKSFRLQDQADIVNLINSSLDIDACRRYLQTNAPNLLPRFEELVTRAEQE
jgi:hypothetical protein